MCHRSRLTSTKSNPWIVDRFIEQLRVLGDNPLLHRTPHITSCRIWIYQPHTPIKSSNITYMAYGGLISSGCIFCCISKTFQYPTFVSGGRLEWSWCIFNIYSSLMDFRMCALRDNRSYFLSLFLNFFKVMIAKMQFRISWHNLVCCTFLKIT